MRGLTRDERRMLEASANPNLVLLPESYRTHALSLASVGRVRLDGLMGYATDLGRLALRVCPVGET